MNLFEIEQIGYFDEIKRTQYICEQTQKEYIQTLLNLCEYYNMNDDREEYIKICNIGINQVITIFMIKLALYYKCEKNNYLLMEKFLKMASDNGDINGLYELGLYYKYEIKNFSKMKIVFEKGIKNGCSKCAVAYGNYFENNELNNIKAIHYYTLAMNLNDYEGAFLLGLFYERKQCDYNRALEFYEKGLEIEYNKCCAIGAISCYKKKKDYDNIINNLKKLVNFNCPSAHLELAKFYTFKEPDLLLARQHIEKYQSFELIENNYQSDLNYQKDSNDNCDFDDNFNVDSDNDSDNLDNSDNSDNSDNLDNSDNSDNFKYSSNSNFDLDIIFDNNDNVNFNIDPNFNNGVFRGKFFSNITKNITSFSFETDINNQQCMKFCNVKNLKRKENYFNSPAKNIFKYLKYKEIACELSESIEPIDLIDFDNLFESNYFYSSKNCKNLDLDNHDFENYLFEATSESNQSEKYVSMIYFEKIFKTIDLDTSFKFCTFLIMTVNDVANGFALLYKFLDLIDLDNYVFKFNVCNFKSFLLREDYDTIAQDNINMFLFRAIFHIQEINLIKAKKYLFVCLDIANKKNCQSEYSKVYDYLYKLSNLINDNELKKNKDNYLMMSICTGSSYGHLQMALKYTSMQLHSKAKDYYIKSIEKGYFYALYYFAINYYFSYKNDLGRTKKYLKLFCKFSCDKPISNKANEFLMKYYKNIELNSIQATRYTIHNYGQNKQIKLSEYFISNQYLQIPRVFDSKKCLYLADKSGNLIQFNSKTNIKKNIIFNDSDDNFVDFCELN